MPDLDVTLAGAVSLRRGDRRVGARAFGARQLRLVTAILVLERDAPVSLDMLAGELWPDQPPAQWKVAVRGLVSQFRRRLVDLGLDPTAVVGDQGRYVVALGDVRVDLEAAARELAAAGDAVEEGALDRATLLAGSARSVLSRPVLSGVESHWLERLRDRVARDHLESLVLLGESRRRLGAVADARRVLAEAIELDPLREDAWRALMRTEVAAGNPARALAAYADCRGHLADELGADPAEETQLLHAELLAAVPDPDELAPAALERVRVEPEAPPYVGLRAFTRADAPRFFGRDAEVQALVERLGRNGIVAVVGPSGVGKSSLVRAGLLPALSHGAIPDSDTWVTVVTSPTAEPRKALVGALASTRDDGDEHEIAALLDGEDGLHDAAGLVLPADAPSARLLVVVDQLEELFTLGSTQSASGFVALLTAATERLDRRVVVVVTLRTDFYDRAAGLDGLADLLSHSQFVVPPMDGEQVEAAITGPARLVGLRLEPGLLGRVVADVAGEPGSLPLLQHLLYELWEHRVDRVLTRGAYDDLGGVTGALAHRAEQVYRGLERDDRAVARRILLRTVQPGEDGGDARRPVPRHEVYGPGDDRDRVDAVVARLVDARLLTADRTSGESGATFELAHEALIDGWPRLRGWVDEVRGWLLDHRRLSLAAREWVAHDRQDDWLLGGMPLDEAHELVLADGRGDVDLHLSPVEHELVAASLEARELVRAWEAEQETRRRELERRSSGRLRMLVAFVVGVALVATTLWWIARQDAAVARAREVLGAASAVVGDDPDLGLLLALEARQIAGDVVYDDAASVLRAGIAAQRAQALLKGVGEVIGWAADGGLVATARVEEGPSGWEVDVRDPATGDVVRTLAGHPGDGSVWSAGWSEDGSVLAVGTRAGTVSVWDWRTGEPAGSIRGPQGQIVTALDVHPDGSLLAGVWQRSEFVGHVEVRGLDGEDVQVFPPLDPEDDAFSGPLAAAFSPDGDRLALVYPGRDLVRVVETETWAEVYTVSQFAVRDAGWSPDGRWLAVAGAETLLVDAESGEVGHELRGPADGAGDVAWAADSSRVAVAGEPVLVWPLDDLDWQDEVEPMVLAGEAFGQPLIAFGEDPDVLYEGSNSGDVVRTWSLANAARAEVAWLPGNDGQMGIDWSPDGRELAASAGEGELAIWSRDGWDARTRFVAHEPASPGPELDLSLGRIVNLDWSPDGARIATAGYDDVAVWDAATADELHRVDTGGGWSTVAWGPEGRHLAVDHAGPVVLVVDGDGDVVSTLEDAEGTDVEDLRFSPDGRFLATARIAPTGAGGPVNETRIYDWERGTVVARLEGAPANVHWDSAGTRLLVAAGEPLLFDTSNLDSAGPATDPVPEGEALVTFVGHQEWVQEAVLSPDEQSVATCSGDGTARLWDVTTGAERQRLVDGGLSGLCRVRFSPDGELLALSDAGNGVRVLTLDTDELARVAASRVLRDLTDEECREHLDLDACPA